MPNFYFRLHEVPVRERNYPNNQTWINYFEDRMPNLIIKLTSVSNQRVLTWKMK